MAGPKPNIQDTLPVIHKSLEVGAFERAETIARHLQQAYPRRADVNDALGHVLLAMGRYEEAETYCRRAVASEKNNAVYLANLGRVLLSMGLVTEAEPLLRRALDLDQRLFLAAWQLGMFYFHAGKGEDAVVLFRKAQSLAPPRARDAIRLDLIDALVALGEREEAKAEIAAGLKAGRFTARLTSLLASVEKALPDSPVARLIEQQLERRDLLPEERSGLLLRKGTMLENAKSYDEAFTAFSAAKRQLTSATDIKAFAHDVDARIAFFTRGCIEELGSQYGAPGESHVFVLGLPRTGTTLVEQIISRHSQAGAMGELETMTYVTAQLRGGKPINQLKERLAELGPARVRELSALYDRVAEYLVPGKIRIVDKMPHHFRYIGEIAILFPHARFVHCLRHPADSFMSAFQNDMNAAHGYSYSPEAYAEYYAHYMRLMDHWKQVLPDRILTVPYETLAASPGPTISQLLAFLELPWEEACLSPHEGRNTVRTFSNMQVRSPINTSSIDRWKPYAKYLGALTAAN